MAQKLLVMSKAEAVALIAAAGGMTGITGCDAHAPPRPFPQPVGRLTSSVIDHAAGNLFRTGRIGFIGFASTPPTGGCSHQPLIG